MRKIYSIIAIICIATLFAACNNEQTPVINPADGDVEVEMSIRTPLMSHARAYIPEEDNINNLYVLVFDASQADDENNATYLYYRHAWQSSGSSYRSVLKIGANLNIYFAANIDESILSDELIEGDTYQAVRDKLILTKPNEIVYNNIPMWGFVLNQDVEESATYANLGEVKLLRSVASADITITAPKSEFEFAEAMVVLATNQGYLSYKSGDITDGKINGPNVPTDTEYDLGNDYSWAYTPEDNAVLNKFYMFDNDATNQTAPTKRYTKMIVAGKYKNGSVSYYPLAFRNSEGDKVQVARNRKFEITITKVNGDGYPTPGEAVNAEDVNMDFNVIVWEDGYVDSDIIIDGTKYVSFSGSKTILLANEVKSDAFCFFSTNAIEWDVETLAPTNLRWSFDDFATHVTENTTSNDRFSVTITKVAGDENYCLDIVADKAYNDASGGSHEAILSMEIGRIRFEIKLKQLENAWADGGTQGVDL